MHCTKCGKKLTARDSFCPKCGAPHKKKKGTKGSGGSKPSSPKQRNSSSPLVVQLLVGLVVGFGIGLGVLFFTNSGPFSSSGNSPELKADVEKGIILYSEMINESAGWGTKCLDRAKRRQKKAEMKWENLSQAQREINPNLQPLPIEPFFEWGGCWWKSVQPKGYKKAFAAQDLIFNVSSTVEGDDTRVIPPRAAFEEGPLQPAECGEAAYRLMFRVDPETAGLTPIEDVENPGYGPGGFDEQYLNSFVKQANRTRVDCDLGQIPALEDAQRTLEAAGPGGFADYSPDQPSSGSSSGASRQAALPTNGEFPERCSNKVVANEVTSCEFAKAVVQEFRVMKSELDPASLEGSGVSVVAESPITGDTYEMTCRKSSEGTFVCREVNASDGKNDAGIQFRDR